MFGGVGEMRIVFLHGESVHICPEGYTVVFSLELSFSPKISNESCGSMPLPTILPNALLFEAKGEKHVFDFGVGLKLCERDFRMRMQVFPEGDYLLDYS